MRQAEVMQLMNKGEPVSDELIDMAAKELSEQAAEAGHDPTSPGVRRWRTEFRAGVAQHNRSITKGVVA